MPCKDVAKRYVESSKNLKENGDDNGKEVDVNLSGLVGDEDNGSCKAAAFCCRHLIRIQAPTLGMTIAMTILITTLMTILITTLLTILMTTLMTVVMTILMTITKVAKLLTSAAGIL